MFWSEQEDITADGGFIVFLDIVYRRIGIRKYLDFASEAAERIAKDALNAPNGGKLWKLLDLSMIDFPKTGLTEQPAQRGCSPHYTRACLKNHSRNLHAPLCGRFHPNSVAVARYAPHPSEISHKIVTHILQKAFFKHALGHWETGIPGTGQSWTGIRHEHFRRR